MPVIDPVDDLPRRDLVDCRLTHGGRCLVLVVERKVGKRYKLLETTYAIERPEGLAGVLNLVRESGEVYEVTAFACTCPDGNFKSRERWCKHRTAAEELGLLEVTR